MIGQCSPVSTCQWLLENVPEFTCHIVFRYDFTESQVASVCAFSVKIAALGSLKRVTERIFKEVSDFKGAS